MYRVMPPLPVRNEPRAGVLAVLIVSSPGDAVLAEGAESTVAPEEQAERMRLAKTTEARARTAADMTPLLAADALLVVAPGTDDARALAVLTPLASRPWGR
jgi:hypothetical protein